MKSQFKDNDVVYEYESTLVFDSHNIAYTFWIRCEFFTDFFLSSTKSPSKPFSGGLSVYFPDRNCRGGLIIRGGRQIFDIIKLGGL